MYTEENLYFIAIIPPVTICDEITSFKQDFASRFASKEALKVIPHITLKAPFKLPKSGHAKLLKWFHTLFIKRESFQIELKNFGAFHNKYRPVVFVHPDIKNQLAVLQKEIIRYFRIAFPNISLADLELTFKPHITVACRDLAPVRFVEAWEEYKAKNYESTFEVNNFYLLQHDSKRWNVIDTYSLLNSHLD